MIKVTSDHYIINGVKYPRISRVLSIIPKPGLERWKRIVGEEQAAIIADESSRIGSMIHKITEFNDTDQPSKLDALMSDNEWLAPFLYAWVEWVNKYVDHILEVERMVVSDKHFCAGTLDRLVVMKGDSDPTLVDIKTGTLVYKPIVGLQLYGYKAALEEEIHKSPSEFSYKTVDKALVVHIPRVKPGNLSIVTFNPRNYHDEFTRTVKNYHEMMS